MNARSLEQFRLLVRRYLSRATPFDGKKARQFDLADAIGLSDTELIRRLRGSGRVPLSERDIKAIIQTLIEWNAITNRSEINELLELADFGLSAAEWRSEPYASLPEVTSTKPSIKRNLLPKLNSTVGRKTEIEALKTLLHEHKLVVILGTGGTGKTHLATLVAQQLSSVYNDSCVFVELTSVRKPTEVASAIVQHLGLKLTYGETPLELLVQYFRDKDTLLVLDNFEQVIEAAPIVDKLLDCAKLRVLVTSRERLGIKGEYDYELASLPLPREGVSSDELLINDSVSLFIQRAAALTQRFATRISDADLELVAKICRGLDGLPLAIELAAAQSDVMSLQDIFANLGSRLDWHTSNFRSALSRQQTLRSTIDWSYELLNSREQMMLCVAALFPAPLAPEAAAAVAGIKMSVAMELLTSLRRKTMLYLNTYGKQYRFTMLDTIRDHSLSHARASASYPTWASNYANYYLEFARLKKPSIDSGNNIEKAWVEEQANLRVAITWLAENNPQLAAELAVTTQYIWRTFGSLKDNATLLINLVSNPQVSASVRMHGLTMASYLLADVSDYYKALELAQQALDLATNLSDDLMIHRIKANIAFQRYFLGYSDQSVIELRNLVVEHSNNKGREYEVALMRYSVALQGPGIYDLVVRYITDLMKIKEGRGSSVSPFLYQIKGNALYYLGNLAEAREVLEKGISIMREAHDANTGYGLEGLLCNLGNVLAAQGCYDDAREAQRQSIAEFEKMSDMSGKANGLNNLGDIAYLQGDYALAYQLQNQSLVMSRSLKWEIAICYALNSLGMVLYTLNDTSRAKEHLAECYDLSIKIGQLWLTAAALAGLADAELLEGNYTAAEEYNNRSIKLNLKMGSVLQIAHNLLGVAAIAINMHNYREATSWLSASKSLMHNATAVYSTFDQIRFKSLLQQCHNNVAANTYDVAWQAGQSTTVESLRNQYGVVLDTDAWII